MNVDDLRAWGMQQPRPNLIRVTSADGQQHEVIPNGPWTKVAETLAALQPELLEAMADGKLLRAVRPNDRSDDWAGDASQPAARARVPSFTDAIPITASDPETQRFALVAHLLADAYRFATTTAFAQLTEIVRSQAEKSEAVERARDQLYRAQIKALEDQLRSVGQEPQEGQELLTNMVGQFLGGMQAGRAPEPPPAPQPAPNGKKGAQA
jgi:hypothetical protein